MKKEARRKTAALIPQLGDDEGKDDRKGVLGGVCKDKLLKAQKEPLEIRNAMAVPLRQKVLYPYLPLPVSPVKMECDSITKVEFLMIWSEV